MDLGLLVIEMDCDQPRSANTAASPKRIDHKKIMAQVDACKSLTVNYFTTESLLVLMCITATLLILPLILPPLPPPPSMLLLVPLAILIVLLILGFRPYDSFEMASSYL